MHKKRAWHWYNFSLDDRKVGFLDRKSRQAMAWLENVGHQFYDWWVGHPLYNATRTFANTFPKNIKLAARQDQFHQINIVFFLSVFCLFANQLQ